MGTISPQELTQMWQRETISPEMAIGHILQNLVNLQKALDATNTTYFTLRADLEEVRNFIQMPKRQRK
jgi:hypothetical protein